VRDTLEAPEMEIREVEPIPLNIPFRRPFTLSRGVVGKPGRPGEHVYLRLVTERGEVGWGEARPMPTWSYETMETVYTTLKGHVAPLLVGEDPLNVTKIQRKLDAALTPVVSSGQPFAKSAVDIAIHDLVGKATGQPLHRLLGGKLADWVEQACMVSGAPEEVGGYAGEMRAEGYRCFKVKIMGDVEDDCRRLAAVREAVGDAAIWADANQAYTSLTVAGLLKAIAHMGGVLCLEQPVPTHDFHGLQRIVRVSPVPIAVDESLFSHYDLLKLLTMNALDTLVLKVAKSGIRTSLKIAHLAEAAGIRCLGSGMTESGVGFAASTHLYSTLDMAAPADTNGPQFLADLLVKGLEFDGPRVRVPDRPGLGVEVDEGKVEEHRVKLKL